ncbi:hypothetical protein [Bordetella genomosp. 4]|uniref:Uncharacterized protein n=1 Tax=Bordetella genomosp. 4 TaxID=463044 RepID=A0A261U6S8_9BORD|nr:hypothetical protein [Bordetella genomosp. 4]OZI57626.1 hypothetical protein CAL20_09625 [Bordetella genomosp. 4]
MTVDTQKLRERLDKAFKRAYLLGQDYWRLADSESWADNRRSNDVQDKFDALRSETVSVAGAQVSILQDEIDRLRAIIRAIDSLRGPFMSDDDVASVWKLVDAALNPPAPPQGEKE